MRKNHLRLNALNGFFHVRYVVRMVDLSKNKQKNFIFISQLCFMMEKKE